MKNSSFPNLKLTDHRRFLIIFIILLAAVNLTAQTKDFTRYVNPLIGTGGHGHIFPGATMPHGAVQLSPDTRRDNWDGSSGYYYSDSVIYGFSHTHLSGTGLPDYCDILFMPTIGEPLFTASDGDKSDNGYASKFSHENEKAEAGYYSVKLDDGNIFAEMTATTRVGFHRYTFPESDKANIILNLKWRDKVLDSYVKIVGKNQIEGFRRSSSWAKDKAANVSDKNIYIKSAKLNGKDYRQAFFTHGDLKNGATIEFEMSDAPVKNWFITFPVSKIESEDFVPVPTIDAARVFGKETIVKISSPETSAKIFYTTDGTEPNSQSKLYDKPFTLNNSSVIKAVSMNESGAKSFPVEARSNRMPHDWTVKILSKYNRQYTGGGDVGLIDGIRGNLNFASGEWQGYQNQDFVAVIDLQKETAIKKVGGGFLQDARPWIWMPTRIEFEVSDDGENFTKVADIKTDVAATDMKPQIKDYAQKIAPIKARFVRVHADNLGKIPAWHPGAGSDAFIFVDEIFIE